MPKGEILRDSFAMTDSMFNLTGSTTSDPSLTNIQSDDSFSFDVTKAMKEYHDIPDNIDILNIDAADDLSILM